MIRRLSLLAVLAVAAVSGCGGGETEFAGTTPVSLDGVWSGTAQRSQGGESTCPGPTPLVLTIANTVVRGEVRDRRNRTVTVSRFDAIVDADGRIVARAWYDSISNDLSLQYNGSRITGRITNPLECIYNVRLSRDR